MYSFEIQEKRVDVFYKEYSNKKVPVVILNTFENEGIKIWSESQKENVNDYILVAISNLDWNSDMTPWKSEAIFRSEGDYQGNADKHLNLIIKEIIPNVENFFKSLYIEIDYYVITGYSLAGLFALYSGYKTNIFKKIVCASGSLWYKDFEEFVKNNELDNSVEKIYFSLGNKEKYSKNEVLKTVEEKTIKIKEYLSNKIEIEYEENEGNHFVDADKRVIKGIKNILN